MYVCLYLAKEVELCHVSVKSVSRLIPYCHSQHVVAIVTNHPIVAPIRVGVASGMCEGSAVAYRGHVCELNPDYPVVVCQDFG